MQQKYKIFYRRHCFVIDKTGTSDTYDLVLNRCTKGMLRSILEYLKKSDEVYTILVTDSGLDCFLAACKRVLAGGGAVYNSNNELLLMKRKGKWDLPKGKLDKGETVLEAAVREVEEEVNVFDIDVEQKIGLTYHIYFDKKWCLKETHWYHMHSGDWTNATPQYEEDIDAIRWVNPADIDIDNLNTYQNIRVVLQKHLQRPEDIS